MIPVASRSALAIILTYIVLSFVPPPSSDCAVPVESKLTSTAVLQYRL